MYLFSFPLGLSGGSKETSYTTAYNTSRNTSWNTSFGTTKTTSFATAWTTSYGTGTTTTYGTSRTTSRATNKTTSYGTAKTTSWGTSLGNTYWTTYRSTARGTSKNTSHSTSKGTTKSTAINTSWNYTTGWQTSKSTQYQPSTTYFVQNWGMSPTYNKLYFLRYYYHNHTYVFYRSLHMQVSSTDVTGKKYGTSTLWRWTAAASVKIYLNNWPEMTTKSWKFTPPNPYGNTDDVNTHVGINLGGTNGYSVKPKWSTLQGPFFYANMTYANVWNALNFPYTANASNPKGYSAGSGHTPYVWWECDVESVSGHTSGAVYLPTNPQMKEKITLNTTTSWNTYRVTTGTKSTSWSTGGTTAWTTTYGTGYTTTFNTGWNTQRSTSRTTSKGTTGTTSHTTAGSTSFGTSWNTSRATTKTTSKSTSKTTSKGTGSTTARTTTITTTFGTSHTTDHITYG